jgi:hypothetical protein
MSARPHMKFQCDQRWEDLRPDGQERTCDRCRSTVVDFTRWDRTDVLAFYKHHPDTCGHFTLQQIEPDLVPLPDLSHTALRGALAIMTALTLTTAPAQNGAAPVSTEQGPLAPASAQANAPEQGGMTQEKCWMPKSTEAMTRVSPQDRRARYHVSGRFPFIHRRRAVRVLGCPSF